MSFLPISGGPVSSLPVATGGGPATTNVAGRVAAAGASTSAKIASVATAGIGLARGAAAQNKIGTYSLAGRISAIGLDAAGKIALTSGAGKIAARSSDVTAKYSTPSLVGRLTTRGADAYSKTALASVAALDWAVGAITALKVGGGVVITTDIAGYLAALGGATFTKVSTPSVSGRVWSRGANAHAKTAQHTLSGRALVAGIVQAPKVMTFTLTGTANLRGTDAGSKIALAQAAGIVVPIGSGTATKIAQAAIVGLVRTWAEMFIGTQCSLTAQDLQAIADRVWHKVLEGGYAAIQMQRLLLAGLAGSRAGIGTATENYYAPDGVTSRIAFAPSDVAGNGVPVLDGGAVPANTAGVSLSSASLDAIATAVWSKAIDGLLTAEETMRINAAWMAGERVGFGTASERYIGLDGVTDRITFAPSDAHGNGTATLNGA